MNQSFDLPERTCNTLPRISLHNGEDINIETNQLYVNLAQNIIEIWKIKSSSDANIAEINAKTTALQKNFDGLLSLEKERTAQLPSVAEIVKGIISGLNNIPEHDNAARLQMVTILPQIVDECLKRRG